MRSLPLLFMTFVLALVSPRASAAETTWELLVPFPGESALGRQIHDFVQMVPELTSGELAIQATYGRSDARPSGYVEGYHTEEIVDSLTRRTVPLAVVNLADLTSRAPALEVIQQPAAVWGMAQAHAFQMAIRPMIHDALEDMGFHLVSTIPVGFRGLFAMRPVNTPAQVRGLRGLAFDDAHAALLLDLGADMQTAYDDQFISDFPKESNEITVASPSVVFSGSPLPYRYFYDLQLQPTLYALVANSDDFASLLSVNRERISLLGDMLEVDVWEKAREAHGRALRALSRRDVSIKAMPHAWGATLADSSPLLGTETWASVLGSTEPQIMVFGRRFQSELKAYYQLQSGTPQERGRPSVTCHIMPIFFATNRRKDEAEYIEGPGAGDLILGRVKVLSVGLNKRSTLPQRPCELRMYEDPCGTVAGSLGCLWEPEEFTPRDFIAHLGEAVAESSRSVTFVHGFNVSFEEAARDFAGPISIALGQDITSILFSWPSTEDRNPKAYRDDRKSAETSAAVFSQFISKHVAAVKRNFLQIVGGSDHDINIVAHSLGTYLVTQAFAEQDLQEAAIDNIVFLAPDLGAAEFAATMAAEKIHRSVNAVTMYMAANDDALRVSSNIINWRVPLGLLSYPVPREPEFRDVLLDEMIDVIDAKDVNHRDCSSDKINEFGHSYYLCPIVQNDITSIIHGITPDKRSNITLSLTDMREIIGAP